MKTYTLTEYEKTGNLLYVAGEYHTELEEFLERNLSFITANEIENYKPPKIYGTDREKIGIDEEDILTPLEESDAAYDDYEVNEEAKKFIKVFVESFNNYYADHSYIVNKDIVIEPTKEELKEIVERILARRKRRG